jgi:hypothetical protein
LPCRENFDLNISSNIERPTTTKSFRPKAFAGVRPVRTQTNASPIERPVYSFVVY